MTDKITSFMGKYFFLSNFYNFGVGVEYDGVIYPSAEHAFQAAKTFNLNEREEIRNIAHPQAARDRGQTVTLRPDWEQNKIRIMYQVLLSKFTIDNKFEKSKPLSTRLQETGSRELIEVNYFNDTFWGVCNNVGQNWMGKLLMEVRYDIWNNSRSWLDCVVKEHERVFKK